MRSLSTLAIEIEPAEASPSAKKQPEAELAVFWEGTGHALAPITTQVGLFYELMEAQDVTHISLQPKIEYLTISMNKQL